MLNKYRILAIKAGSDREERVVLAARSRAEAREKATAIGFEVRSLREAGAVLPPLSERELNLRLVVVALMTLAAIALAVVAAPLPARWRDQARAATYLKKLSPPRQYLDPNHVPTPFGGDDWANPNRGVFSGGGGPSSEFFAAAQRNVDVAAKRVRSVVAAAAGAIALALAAVMLVRSTANRAERYR